MSGRVAGLVAIVTGAGSGIGQASAVRLAEEGAIVVCADINEGAAQATVDSIKATGAKAVAAAIDISDSDACTALVNQTVRDFGSIDVLAVSYTHLTLPTILRV